MKRRRSRVPIFVFLLVALAFGFALSFAPPGRGLARAQRAKDTSARRAPGPPRPAAASSSAGAPSASAHAAPAATLSLEVAALAAEDDDGITSLPKQGGLPVAVNAAVFFLEVADLDDAKGEFECTTDVRFRWTDERLKALAADDSQGYREYRGSAAEALLKKIWAPKIDVANLVEAPSSYMARRLRIYKDGTVESIARTTAKYEVEIDPERFPFDQQKLVLELVVREEDTDRVELLIDKEDVAFSRLDSDAKLTGWTPGFVELKESSIQGWNGERYAHVTAALTVLREPQKTVAPIFIPLVASLLIPLLAIWMNRATEEGFHIEAFELANMAIGGLFSVIALSLAIYSSYGVIASSDNTVTRLFGLNYASLAAALVVIVLFFRYNVLMRLFGHHVQQETFRFLSWAMPLLSLAAGIAFLLVSAA